MKVAHELRQHPDVAASERCVRCGKIIKISGPTFQDMAALIVVEDQETGSWQHVSIKPVDAGFCDE
jgi:hypothetical protein